MKLAFILSILVVCQLNFQYVENCFTQLMPTTTTMAPSTKMPSTMMNMMDMTTKMDMDMTTKMDMDMTTKMDMDMTTKMDMDMTTMKKTTGPVEPPKTYKALAVVHGSYKNSSIYGLIQFTQKGDEPIYVKGNITGLPLRPLPALHGFHIHARTIVSLAKDVSRCGSTLGHYNPFEENHGNLGDDESHKGDYGNVIASKLGNIDISIMDHMNHLFGPKGIVGRTVVLHARADDLGQGGNAASLANGNAGPRIACGIIGAL